MSWEDQHNPYDDDYARHAKAMLRAENERRAEEVARNRKRLKDQEDNEDQEDKKSGLGKALGVAFILILILLAFGS